MRRIRIAIFILLLAAALSAASHFAVFRVTQSVQAQLSGIRAAAGAQNYENAAHQIDALLEYYETRQHLLEFFIRRETVTSSPLRPSPYSKLPLTGMRLRSNTPFR